MDYFVRHNGKEPKHLTIPLRKMGESARIFGVFFGRESDSCELTVTVEHLAPHTTSEIVIVGALGGQAKANVRGCIRIAPGAVKSNAREEIRTLLLSKDASVRAMPELNIENNDVQCSHAVTTTHIDEIKKFYLESRGMTMEDAEQAIIAGHFADILKKFPEHMQKQLYTVCNGRE